MSNRTSSADCEILWALARAIVDKAPTAELMGQVRTIIQTALDAVGFSAPDTFLLGFEKTGRAARTNSILWKWPICDANSRMTLLILCRMAVRESTLPQNPWSLDVSAMVASPRGSATAPLAFATLETTSNPAEPLDPTLAFLETQYTDLTEHMLVAKPGDLTSLAKNFAAQLTAELSA